MPDLATAPIRSWLDSSEPDEMYELPIAARRAELDPTIESAVVALGVALDDAYARDPDSLAKRIRTDPARTIFQSVLAQLGSDRLLRLLDWLTEPDKPNRQAILAALLTPGSGPSSDAIRRAARFASRRVLLTRMISDRRIASLVACGRERHRDKLTRRRVRP
jgi:hypothetical protein